MDDFTEFRLRIEGTFNGVEITPETLPLARLVQYLRDIAAMMGDKDHVHLIRVAEGSAMPILYVANGFEAEVTQNMQLAQKGIGSRDANVAYKRFDERLREDSAVAEVMRGAEQAKVVVFPGRNGAKAQEYSLIREAGELTGELKRVGGLDETVPIWLRRGDGEVLRCTANEHIAQELGNHLYQVLRVHGVGFWNRNREGVWRMEKFNIQSFDPTPLSAGSFAEALEKLKAIPGNAWVNSADPLRDLRAIRDGEEERTA